MQCRTGSRQAPGQGRLGLGRGNCGFFPAELAAHLPRFSLRANGETPVWSLQQEVLEPDKKWNFLSPLQSMRGSLSWEKLQEAAVEGGERQCAHEGNGRAGSLACRRSGRLHLRACRGGHAGVQRECPTRAVIRSSECFFGTSDALGNWEGERGNKLS